MNAPYDRNNFEMPSGIGTVFQGQAPIATVRYSLEIRPVLSHRRSLRCSPLVNGANHDVSGRVEIISGGLIDAAGGIGLLVLALEDGRQLPFYRADIGSTIRILAAGGCW